MAEDINRMTDTMNHIGSHSNPSAADYDRDDAFLRRVFLLGDYHALMGGASRYYLHRLIAAARAEGQAAWAGGEVRTEVKDGVIRQSVMVQASETTTTSITVAAPEAAPEPEGEGLYDIDVTWTNRDQWTIRASSADEALEIAKEQGFDAVEDYSHDMYPDAVFGVPERREV